MTYHQETFLSESEVKFGQDVVVGKGVADFADSHQRETETQVGTVRAPALGKSSPLSLAVRVVHLQKLTKEQMGQGPDHGHWQTYLQMQDVDCLHQSAHRHLPLLPLPPPLLHHHYCPTRQPLSGENALLVAAGLSHWVALVDVQQPREQPAELAP